MQSLLTQRQSPLRGQPCYRAVVRAEPWQAGREAGTGGPRMPGWGLRQGAGEPYQLGHSLTMVARRQDLQKGSYPVFAWTESSCRFETGSWEPPEPGIELSCLVIVEVELRRASESNGQRERGKINKPESFLKINTGLQGQPGEVSALSRAAGSRAVPGTLKVFGDCLAVG